MSIEQAAGVAPPGAGDAPPAQPRRRRRWGKSLAIALTLLLISGAVAGLVWGAHYQPVALGGTGGNLNGHIVTKHVNDFPPMLGQTYLPPQKPSRGGVYVSLTNDGPFPVTIESVTLNNPDYAGSEDRQAQVLRDTGPSRYWPLFGPSQGVGPGSLVAGMTLRPRQYVLIRIPVTSAGCWTTCGGYQILSAFWVRFRFGIWTHLVPISWTSPDDQSGGAIIAHSTSVPGGPSVCPR